MSELDKVKDLATAADIDADALLTELGVVLLAGSKEMIESAVAQMNETQDNNIVKIAGALDAKLHEFQESMQAGIGERLETHVRDVMGPLMEDAKKMNETRAKLEEAIQAGGGNSSSPESSNSNGVTQQALLTEGLGIVKALIEQGNPVTQLTKMAELRRAMYEFEGQGPSPDTQARITTQTFLEGVKIGGNAKSGPLGGKPSAGSGAPSGEASKPSPSAPRPAKSLRDVVREIG